ncbi:MAG TPA: polysaccharide biosynthesis tyrosine autokinase [Planctomycetota bacterium]|nr:polysaccharide biosynthesis tyrosine autokinase [Planctomycetota bacterium]
MTFKDLIRLLRRRWLTAGLVFAAVFCGYMAVSAVTERPQYRARARILISTPPILVTATQGTQWISVTQMDPKTWISIISSARVRSRAEAALRKLKTYDVQADWFANVGASLDTDGQLAWIEAVGPTPDIAADIANVVAWQAEEYSREIAGVDVNKAREKTSERLQKERDVLSGEDDKIRKLREDARARLSSDNLEIDVRKLEEEILSHETRRRDLERRGSTNRLRLERIRSDRSVAEHLQREGVPRLATASGESRIADSPLVRQVSDRLEVLHRELLAAVRRYTEEHPLVKGLRADIRQTELDLTRARIQALGSDIDREELTLRTDNELIAIEIRVLEPEVKELRDRLTVLTPVLDEVKLHDRLAQDSRGRISTIETLREQLSATPESGYVRRLEDIASPSETVRIEMRLRKSWGLALLASVIFGIGFAFVREFIDTTLRTDYDVRRHLDYPVLAVAPRVGSNEVLTLRASRASIMAEIYDTLATVLLSAPSEHPSRIFMVTSTNPQEGKTVTSINLAVALARQGKRTLLVDGDMRVPSIHTSLTLPSSPGLSEVLAGSVALNAEGVLQDCEVPNLKVLPCGVQPESPYELLDPSRTGPIAAQMREMFDIVVFDTPPILRTGDALKISTVADQSLFVVEAGRTEQRQASWAKRLLTNVGARVSGVVLNRAVTDTEEYYYYYGTGTGQSRKEARAR